MRMPKISIHAIAAICLVWSAIAAHAGDGAGKGFNGRLNGPPALFTFPTTSQVQDRFSAGRNAADREVRRRQSINIDANAFALPTGWSIRDVRDSSSFVLPLFDGKSIVVDRERIERTPRGTAWIGTVRDVDLSQVVLVNNGDIVSGNISMPGSRYHIRLGKNGTHEIQEIDQSAFPAYDEKDAPTPSYNTAADVISPTAMKDDGSTIDVLVVYTPAARSAAGGTTAMQSLVDLAVTETNLSYQNSGISQRIRLVYTGEVSYTESGSFSTDLTRLTNTDGHMDDVHTLRTTYGADLVSLWVESGDACGVAWRMTTVSTSFAPYGFSVAMRSCATGYYTFGHELGHNMGATHDSYVDTSTSPYTYAHGYVNTSARWRTVMAYDNACNAQGFSCSRIQYWSNPSISYLGNVLGNSTTADNRQTLNNTAYTVANFKQSLNNVTCSNTISPSSASVSASGGSGTITVTANTGCAWTASSNASWITISSGSSGSGSGSVTYTVSANTSTNLRSGTLTVAGQTYTIVQSGASTTSGSNGINEGGFESGGMSWTKSNAIINSTITNPYGGHYSAALGNYTSSNSYIYQDVAIPANATKPMLQFWYKMSTQETTTTDSRDQFSVSIQYPSQPGYSVQTLLGLSNLSSAPSWTRSPEYDLSAYKGKTIRLYFYAYSSPSLPTKFYVDDISLTGLEPPPTLRQALFVNASTSTNKTSVVRITNTTDTAGIITATAYDEAGTLLGTQNASLGNLGAYKTLAFRSVDLERAIGFSPASPTSKYSVYFSNVGISNYEVVNLTRDIATGGLTLSQAQVRDRNDVSAATCTRTAWFVSASSSPNKTNVLRIVNTSAYSGTLNASVYGENGTVYASNVTLGTIAAHEMKSYTSAELERALNFTPPAPTAKYRVEFTAIVPNIELINFTRDLATGTLTLVQSQLDERASPSSSYSTRNALLVYPSTSTMKTTVMRIINPNASPISVSASVYDENGTKITSGSLGSIDANQILALTSAQLESALRYSPSSSNTRYRMELTANASTFEVVNNIKSPSTGNLYLAHVQTDTRDATSTSGGVTRNAYLIYPSANKSTTTELLVINPTSQFAVLRANAYDENGTKVVSDVSMWTLGPNKTATFTSTQLENMLGYTPPSDTLWRIVFTADLSNFEIINYAKDVATGMLTLAQPQTD